MRHKSVIQQKDIFPIDLYSFLFLFEVHADIKPDNIILVDNILKITDLGLAFGLSSPSQVVRRPTVRGTLGIYT